MVEGSTKDLILAVLFKEAADNYEFPQLICEDCGKHFDCSDILKGIAEGLRQGIAEHK